MADSSSHNVSIPFHALSPGAPSLCIPRVFNNISWKRVKDVLEEEYNLGEVERVDMIPMKNEKGESFKRVFVHFVKWGTSEDVVVARKALLAGDMIQIVYDDPWYWKIGMSHVAKPERRTGHKGGKRTAGGKRTPLAVVKKTAPRRAKPATHHATPATQQPVTSTIGDIKEQIDAAEKSLADLRCLMSEKVAALVDEDMPTPPPLPPLVVRKQVPGWGGEPRGTTVDGVYIPAGDEAPLPEEEGDGEVRYRDCVEDEGLGGELRTTPPTSPSVVDEVAQGVADAVQEKESDEAAAERIGVSKDLCGN